MTCRLRMAPCCLLVACLKDNVSMHQFTPLKKNKKNIPLFFRSCMRVFNYEGNRFNAPLLYSHKARQDKASSVFSRLHGNQFFALAKHRTPRALVASGIEGCKIVYQSNIEQLYFGGISNISHADHFQLLYSQ